MELAMARIRQDKASREAYIEERNDFEDDDIPEPEMFTLPGDSELEDKYNEWQARSRKRAEKQKQRNAKSAKLANNKYNKEGPKASCQVC